MVEVVNTIETLINECNYDVDVISWTIAGGVYTLKSDNTSYISERDVIEIEGSEYSVSNVLVNDSFDLTPLDGGALTDKKFTISLSPIAFYAGTLRDIDGERGSAKRLNREETPFCWLREPFTIDRNYDRSVEHFGSVDFDLYFMGACDPDNMLSEDHRKKVIYPMHNVADIFFRYLRDERRDIVYKIERCVIRQLANIGREDADGMTERLFDENLSGVECRTTMSLETICKK